METENHCREENVDRRQEETQKLHRQKSSKMRNNEQQNETSNQEFRNQSRIRY